MNIWALCRHTLASGLLLSLCVPDRAFGQDTKPTDGSSFVDIKQVDPTILVDLRYAGPNNFTRRPLYSPGMPALLRFSVAQRLASAQKHLKAQGYGLKIWDAYRPGAAQKKLWEAIRNGSYVADPKEGVGSMHTRGAAVDVTLVDRNGNEIPMPTGFDSFTPAAMLNYQGGNPVVRLNLKLLQKAMARAGFYGLRTEWWHFCAADWTSYPPAPDIQLQAQTPQQSP